MAFALAKPDTAHYFHATLEQFCHAAVQDIRRLFYAAAAALTTLEHEPVELTYDETDHVFTLRHHNRLGSQLDDALCRIIRNHAASESAEVTRFAECALGDPFDEEEEVGSEQSDTPNVDDQALTTHLVNFDGINTYGKARAFHLRDLPPALRNRILSRHNILHLATTVSLRRVQLDPQNEQQVFGGSLGDKLPKLSDAEIDDMDWFFQLSRFGPFTRTIRLSAPRDPQPEVEPERYSGEEPRIGQWLQGMGDTRQVDPNAQPEMGGEQYKFASGRTLHNNALARVRKPKGIPLVDNQIFESPPVVQLDAESSGFAALMRPGAIGDAFSDSPSSDPESDEANPFESMRPVKVVEAAKSDTTSSGAFTPLPTPQGQGKGALVNAAPSSNASSSRPHPRSHFLSATASSQGAPISEGVFPNDGRSYARADRFGLTGDAANHVAWEKENAATLLSRPSKRAPRTYDEMASTRAESATASGRDSNIDSLAITAVTPMSYSETPLGGNEPWARNIVRPEIIVPMGNLVNTDVSLDDTSPPKAPQYPPGLANTYASVANTNRPKPRYPPGLYPPLGSIGDQRSNIVDATNAARVPRGSTHPATSQTTERNTSTKDTQEDDALISFPDEKSSTQTTPQEDDDLMSFKHDDDGPLIEYGKAPDEEAPRLYRTMGQQTRSKHQKKKNKASTNRSTPFRPAQLELPSPPPPPKPKQSTVIKKDVKAQVTAKPEQSLHLEQAIDNLLSSSSFDEKFSGVEIRFGLALMTDADDLVADRGLRSADMQEKLDDLLPEHRNAIFPQVLGRRLEDGVCLLRLPTTLKKSISPYAGEARLLETWQDAGLHGIHDMRSYEITIAVPGGCEWLLTFDPEEPEDVQIRPLKDVQQQTSIYIHYPERVWDARIRSRPNTSSSSNKPHADLNEPLERNIRTFLQTFHSTESGAASEDGLPDFEAIVPESAFVITNFLAKREFIRNMVMASDAPPPEDSIATGSGSTWVVSQVWDLHVQGSPLNRGRVNNSNNSVLAIFAQNEETMRSRGRVWWEACLKYEEAPRDDDNELEVLLNEVVARLDSVGMPSVPAAGGGGGGGGAGTVSGKGKAARGKEYVPYW